MDLAAFIAALDPAYKAAGIGCATLALVSPLSKLASEHRINRLSHRKQVSDLITDLTESKVDNEAPHPLAVQAKFQAATGCHPTRVPPGKEITAFLGNLDLADQYNFIEYAYCAEFVAYGGEEITFVPRGVRTLREMKKQKHGDFALYIIIGTFICYLISREDLGPLRYLLVACLFPYALFKASRSAKISRALRFLDRLKKSSTEMPTTDPSAEEEGEGSTVSDQA